MKKVMIFCMVVVLLVLTGCADQVPYQIIPNGMENVGFFHGFWHGYILVFSWFISLFSDNTAIYAVYNNGGWYDFGFILGVGGILNSPRVVSKSRKP